MLCIECRLTHSLADGRLSTEEPIKGSLQAHGRIKAKVARKVGVNASLERTSSIRATLSGVLVNAYFSYSCPIEYIKSCYSLGGWDDGLGWDNEQGWKD